MLPLFICSDSPGNGLGVRVCVSNGSVDPKESDCVNVGPWTRRGTPDYHLEKNQAQSRHPLSYVE